ncbi:phospholipid carrier-dependent glycosyltransferase [Candidatus Woesearchaeota archaeon]|nr:phospholipid carrier-dependent glycosyltransferase [Candidatus Woesearchaeota archaeon]MBT4321882.1 phospholipid carrier-dependent glycosyltransferase [Candidatus Woesearchaeota archaeon]
MPVKLWDETIYLNLGADLSNNLLDYSFSNGWSDFIPSGGDDFYGYPKAGFRAPLLPYLISFFYIFNLGFLANFLIPLIGALSVILIYKLGKELFNEKIALISSLFFAFIPLHVFYSGRVLTGVLFTFFVLLTFLSFWRGYEKNNKKHKVLFGVFLALALLSRYTALWIVPIFFLYFLARDKSLKFLKDKYLWYSILAFFGTLIPWFIYGIFEYNNPLGAFIHGAKASAYWGGLQPWHFFFDYWWQMFSIVGIIFMIALIYILYKKEFFKKEIYLLLIWFAFFLGMAIYMPHKEDRFILAIVPTIALISGYFIDKIKRYKKQILIVIIGVLLLSLCLNFYSTYKTYHNTNTDCFEQVGKELKTIQGNFLIVSENPPLFRYYAQQESAYYPDNLNEETLKEIANSANKKVYFVFTRFNSGFETEKWQNLNQIMKEDYNLFFECSKDKEVNWIYSN